MDWEAQGGAAFPVDTHDDTPLDAETGMSLRDWFAGQALARIAELKPSADETALAAYAYADAMLRVRDKAD